MTGATLGIEEGWESTARCPKSHERILFVQVTCGAGNSVSASSESCVVIALSLVR